MLTLENFDHVLVEYNRSTSRFAAYVKYVDGIPVAQLTKVRGKIFGVMVAIGPDVIGWSLCDPRDDFDRAKGITIALGRALTARNLSFRQRQLFYNKVPHSQRFLLEKMKRRSERFFPAEGL